MKTYEEEKNNVLYDLEMDDFDWLSKNKIKENEMEYLMDLFEKETGYSDELISLNQMDSNKMNSFDSRVIQSVHSYWKKKRQSRVDKWYPIHGRPLLNEYETPPDPNDLSPNIAFRPRVEEKQMIRKYRKNDEESWNRLKILKEDLEKLKEILDQIQEREKLKQMLNENTMSWLRLKMNSNVDKSSEMV
jgi:hypothetical protein